MIHTTIGTYRRFSSNKTEADIVQWDYGSWPAGLPKKDGANALSGAGSLDTATTRPSKTSRAKNLIIEYTAMRVGMYQPKIAHSIGFSGGQLSSYVEGSSALDFPLIHDAQSQDPP